MHTEEDIYLHQNLYEVLGLNKTQLQIEIYKNSGIYRVFSSFSSNFLIQRTKSIKFQLAKRRWRFSSKMTRQFTRLKFEKETITRTMVTKLTLQSAKAESSSMAKNVKFTTTTHAPTLIKAKFFKS